MNGGLLIVSVTGKIGYAMIMLTLKVGYWQTLRTARLLKAGILTLLKSGQFLSLLKGVVKSQVYLSILPVAPQMSITPLDHQ